MTNKERKKEIRQAELPSFRPSFLDSFPCLFLVFVVVFLASVLLSFVVSLFAVFLCFQVYVGEGPQEDRWRLFDSVFCCTGVWFGCLSRLILAPGFVCEVKAGWFVGWLVGCVCVCSMIAWFGC